MPERRFETAYWSDPFVMKLPANAKLLYVYLWTNIHCNQAGLYEIAVETISFETGLLPEEVPELMSLLEPKVTWLPEQNLVWVKNFLRRQSRSPKFTIAAVESLENNKVPEDIKAEFELHNQDLLDGVAPSQNISLTKRECVGIRDGFICQYCHKEILEGNDFEMDHVIPITKGGKDNYLNLATSCRDCNQKKFDKTPSEAGLPEPNTSSFHGAQAAYLLKTNQNLLQRWLMVFPKRQQMARQILGDKVNQYSSILNNIGGGYPSPSPSYTHASANAKRGGGIVKGENEGETIPPSESEYGESLSEGDREVISVWKSVSGFKMKPSAMAELVSKLRTDFPDVDLLVESKKWAARKLSDPLDKKARPSGQIYNFMEKRHKWNQEKKGGAYGADKRPSAKERETAWSERQKRGLHARFRK